jgi:hypothetical protein
LQTRRTRRNCLARFTLLYDSHIIVEIQLLLLFCVDAIYETYTDQQYDVCVEDCVGQ